jgi:hypothetical protein
VEKLISFVMNNFFIVVIVLGIIYSLFFRKSPLERRPNRMPDFGGGGGPSRTGESSPPNARNTRSPDAVESGLPGSGRQTSSTLLMQQPLSQADPKPTQRSSVSQSNADARAPRITSDQYGAEGLTRDDLSRAVVWAEILGPPRARRPHRR